MKLAMKVGHTITKHIQAPPQVKLIWPQYYNLICRSRNLSTFNEQHIVLWFKIDEILGEENLGQIRGGKPKIRLIAAIQPKWEAKRSKTRLEGCSAVGCIFPNFFDIFEKFRQNVTKWH